MIKLYSKINCGLAPYFSMAKRQMGLTGFMSESLKNRGLKRQQKFQINLRSQMSSLSRQLPVQTRLKREQEISRKNGLGSFLGYARPTEI